MDILMVKKMSIIESLTGPARFCFVRLLLVPLSFFLLFLAFAHTYAIGRSKIARSGRQTELSLEWRMDFDTRACTGKKKTNARGTRAASLPTNLTDSKRKSTKRRKISGRDRSSRSCQFWQLFNYRLSMPLQFWNSDAGKTMNRSPFYRRICSSRYATLQNETPSKNFQPFWKLFSKTQ